MLNLIEKILIHAIESEQTKIINLLIILGVNVNYEDEYGTNALMIAT